MNESQTNKIKEEFQVNENLIEDLILQDQINDFEIISEKKNILKLN